MEEIDGPVPLVTMDQNNRPSDKAELKNKQMALFYKPNMVKVQNLKTKRNLIKVKKMKSNVIVTTWL